MKRALYTLANEEFIFFVNKLGRELKKRAIPHIFVGGTAVQAHILDKLYRKTECDISSLNIHPQFRLQDFLRATDDIDLALKFPDDGNNKNREVERANTIYDFLDSLKGEDISDTGNYIFKYDLQRKGVKRPIFGVSVGGEPIEAIALNISSQPKDLKGLDSKFYNIFIDARKELEIPHFEDSKLQINVPKLEHVLATKILNYRGKDIMDIYNLTSLNKEVNDKIDMKEIKKILSPEYIKKYEKFQALVNNNH